MSVSLNPAINNAGTNKIYVPVQKSSLLYSHFEHVSGFVANKGQNGVSVSKIQILNALIDHLSSVAIILINTRRRCGQVMIIAADAGEDVHPHIYVIFFCDSR